ncbi:uncharacterized protein LOC135666303 isoform X5 [Musa acuminata AAA Group]|uniref:uncharacterized protein LOC135666303 isoform X5 n=1 Tax=Musa acuminata AAA Group TaxID=214697 RepID=UPI0031DF6C1C
MIPSRPCDLMIPSRPSLRFNDPLTSVRRHQQRNRSGRGRRDRETELHSSHPVVPLVENPYLCSSGDRSRRRALPPDKSFWSFRSYSSARPIVRAGMEGINVPEHASDDSWCDDGLLNEISDADLNREQKRRYDQFYTFIRVIEMVYLQERKLLPKRASTLGLSNLQAVVTNGELLEASQDQFKEKLVKKLEDRCTFQSLYKPVQEISTDDALRMYHFQLQQENKQSHQRSKATVSSAIEDFDCNKLDFFFKELMLLVSESSEIKASVDVVKGEEEE